jgi:hypothetical protein
MAEETSEAAQRRRRLRWITLGEFLGVAALVISGLTFWNSYSERRDSEEEEAAEEREASNKARILVLRATRDKEGDRLVLSAAGDQVIQGQTIRFPKALGVDPVDSADPRIEADWFADGLKNARRAAGADDRPRGDARIPVVITTRFTIDGDVAEDVSLYDIGYAVKNGGLFGGTSIKLRGLSLIGRSNAKAAPARLDALWQARNKGKS